MDIVSLKAAYESGQLTPSHIVRAFIDLEVAPAYAPVWISKFDDSALLARAAAFTITASEGGALHLPMLRERYADYEPLPRAPNSLPQAGEGSKVTSVK